ncbi:MAG TPA: hypothetical protein VEB23_08415 [Ramlibacter sp.]|nr:hypothetical protein [Ramlibacter sp.]
MLMGHATGWNGAGWAGVGLSAQGAGQSMALGEAMMQLQNKKILDSIKQQLDMAVMTLIRSLCEALSKVIKSAGEGVKNLA